MKIERFTEHPGPNRPLRRRNPRLEQRRYGRGKADCLAVESSRVDKSPIFFSCPGRGRIPHGRVLSLGDPSRVRCRSGAPRPRTAANERTKLRQFSGNRRGLDCRFSSAFCCSPSPLDDLQHRLADCTCNGISAEGVEMNLLRKRCGDLRRGDDRSERRSAAVDTLWPW